MPKKFYITTPLYYVNASPHIGHSYTTIAADCVSRFKRNHGIEVYFLTGTDEHGQKIQRVAEESKEDVYVFTNRMAEKFKELWKNLAISYDDFIRTTEDRHVQTVQKVIEILHKKGDIFEDEYSGWYCTPCETFWVDSQIENQVCPDCKRSLEHITEKNFFFRLSKYQDWLLEYIKCNPKFIQPSFRKNEIQSFLELNRLTDLCISRPKARLSWGIPIPFNSDYVVYVWFDALINYISAVGKFDDSGRYSSELWPADAHLIGKDILRQHAIYWPIMLHALDIQPPKAIFAHGWWMVGENKMSKSRGNVINPVSMVDKFGLDAYRYFLLRDVPFGLDGNFSEEALVNRLNNDLANDLGNLVHRTVTMVEKYFEGKMPEIPHSVFNGHPLNDEINRIEKNMELYLSDLNFSACLESIWVLINKANKLIEDTKPWVLLKENKIEELSIFLYLLIQVIRKVTDFIAPFMPQAASAIRIQIESDRIKKGNPLFPRIEKS